MKQGPALSDEGDDRILMQITDDGFDGSNL